MDDRTKIAAMAMQGMLANNKRGPNSFGQYPHEYESFATAAVSLADALIAALRETPDRDFLADFAAKQEPLGAEFEAAMNADREKLYSDDPNDALDTLTAEAQEAGEYGEVGDWRRYVRQNSKRAIFHVADGRFVYADEAFHWWYTPQGYGFWYHVQSGRATPAEEARARDFARRVLEAMEKADE